MGKSEFTNRWLAKDGPTIPVDVGQPLDIGLLPGRMAEPQREILALVNTGSHKTWIDQPILNRLRLKPVRETSVPVPPTGPVEVGVYQVALTVRFQEGGDFHLPFVRVYSADLRGHAFGVMIGRDLLQRAEALFSYRAGAGWYLLRFGEP
jgi:hypothetical protein